MTKREIDKAFNLSGKWLRYSKHNNEAGMVCRCIYDHLREYYLFNGVDEPYIAVVCALEDLIPPSKLFVFIILGLHNVVDNNSLIGKFIHSVLVKDKALRPDKYKFIDDMDLTKLLKQDSVRINGGHGEIYIQEEVNE